MEDKGLKIKMKNITTYVQILPSSMNPCWEDVKFYEGNKNVYVRCIRDFGKGKNNDIPNYNTFRSDGVFYKFNQEKIYDTVMFETLNKAILGTDVLIFAYGQTGSGKSCTISGLQNPYQSRGLVPRIISELLELKEKCKHESILKYRVSFVEVTKSSIIDLLMLNKGNKNVNLHKKVQILKLNSELDGLQYLFKGEEKKAFVCNSYASHLFTSIFTIHVANRSRVISNPVDRFSKIHIVDMAGIDTSGNRNCAWKTSIEANLNKSQLELCLMLMCENLVKNRKLIRNAGILVDYLGNSLKPQNIIKFIAHIRISRDDLPLTISALKFSNTVRNIDFTKCTQFVTHQSPASLLVNESLKDELINLKKQHDLNSMLLNKDLSYNITQSRIDHMKNSVDDYINDKSNELYLQNLTDIKTILKIMKDKYSILKSAKMDIFKQQNQRKSLTKKSSNRSMTTLPILPNMSFRNTSYDSQNSKKRRSSDKLSKRSKQHSISEIKTSFVGTTIRSGIYVGQLLSHNYQGNIMKSLKHKSITKGICRDSKETTNLNNLFQEDTITNITKFDLKSLLADDFDKTWNSYKTNKNYSFTDMNHNLKSLKELIRDMIKQYNEITYKLENTLHVIDKKKNDLLKIQLYKDIRNLQYKPIEPIKINNMEQDINKKIGQLNDDNITLREKLLAIQTEITINADDYCIIKNNINENFRKYCIDKLKIENTNTPQYNYIEDTNLRLKVDKVHIINLEDKNLLDIYHKLQTKLINIQQERKFCKFHN